MERGVRPVWSRFMTCSRKIPFFILRLDKQKVGDSDRERGERKTERKRERKIRKERLQSEKCRRETIKEKDDRNMENNNKQT